MGVESSIVCDIIASADEDGLMSITKEDFTKETKTLDDAGKEFVKFTLEDAIIPPNAEAEKQFVEDNDQDEEP